MKKTVFAIFFIMAAINAMAVPAFPGMVSFSQPGTDITLNIYLKGDERVHWAETEDGYSLLHRDDGCLVYAVRNQDGDMICSELLAHNKESRGIAEEKFLASVDKHLRFSQRQVDEMLQIWKLVENAKSGPKSMSDVIGSKKFLVILFGFSDKQFTYGKIVFRQLFNQINYSANGMTGSVRDYYREVSHGLFSLTVDLAGPYIGSENTAFYGDSDMGYQYFAKEAVDSAAQDVDFSNYDNDGDGYIDGLHIIFAGYGEEAGGSAECIWSHKWNIFDPPTYNNTVIDVYSCSPELNGNMGDDITNIGVICHELGHVFGSPDYYDTDYAGSGGQFPGLGNWDIMSSGSWNRNGKTPAHHNPYTKIYIYHWATCNTIDATPGSYTLDAVDNTNADFLRVNTSTTGDFFLLENRQKIKWDKHTPGHGLLVYHVHPSAYGSSVANYRHPQQIYILAKSDYALPVDDPESYGDVNSSDAAFPGNIIPRDSLTDNTTPSNRPWTDVANNIPITFISENSSDKTVSFTINNSPDPTDVDALGLDNSTIILNWFRHGGYPVLILINDDNDTFGTPDHLYSAGDTVEGGGIVAYYGDATSLMLDSMLSNHLYHFKLFSHIRGDIYSDGVRADVSTLNCDQGEWRCEDFEQYTTGQSPACWTGDWTVTEDGDSKTLSSPVNPNGQQWHTIVTRPISLDSTRDAVARFRLKANTNDTAILNSLFKTKYHLNATSRWTTPPNISMQENEEGWMDVFAKLSTLGDNSQIRFSATADGNSQVMIDDLCIADGVLITSASSDHGTILPMGGLVLNEDNTMFTMRANENCRLKGFKKDGIYVSWDHLSFHDNGDITYLLENDGSDHTIFVEFEPTESIGDITTAQAIRVCPNPTDGLIKVLCPNTSDITLYDITGKIIMRHQTTSDETTLDLSAMMPGIYIMKCDGSVTKIVKQ